MIGGDLAQQCKEWRRLDLRRGHAHQPGNRQVGSARLVEQRRYIVNGTAALLRLVPDVHLDKQRHPAAHFVHRAGKRGQQRGAIERMDRVKQADRVLGLVRLQLANQVQANVGLRRDQRGPFALRLLHPVFAEHALPLIDQRLNRIGITRFGNCDQRNSVGLACGQRGRAGDARMDRGKRGQVDIVGMGGLGHVGAYSASR